MSNHRGPVPAWLNESYIEIILRKHFKEPNLKVQKMDVTPGSQEGDNYACQILRIKLLLETSGEKKPLSIIGKLKPKTKLSETIVEDMDIFEIEGKAFDELFPALQKLTKGVKGAKKFAPDCYNVDFENSLVLMEDLSDKGFVLQPKRNFLSKEQALLVIEAYATLHGSSYQLVQQDPSVKKTFEKGLFGSEPNEILKKWFGSGVQALNKNMNNYGMSEDWCRKLRAVGENLEKEFLKICDFKEDNLNIIRHGDCWLNNMLFHFTDGVPDDVILLDFQIMTYNSFTHDLHYFLFCNLEADVLINDLDDILEAYYNKLKEIAPEIPNLTLERIRRDFAEAQYLGCVVVIIFRAFICVTTPPDFDKLLAGEIVDMGFNEPKYIADLHKLLPLMEKAGVF